MAEKFGKKPRKESKESVQQSVKAAGKLKKRVQKIKRQAEREVLRLAVVRLPDVPFKLIDNFEKNLKTFSNQRLKGKILFFHSNFVEEKNFEIKKIKFMHGS